MIPNVADLTSDHKLIAQLFDSQPDSVMWYTPKFANDNKNVPIDFLVGFANSAACSVLKVTKHALNGASLLATTLIDEQTKKNIWEQCLEVWQTGNHKEFTYYVPGAQKYFCTQRSKLLNGILSLTRDHTKFIEEHNQFQHQAKLLNQIIESSVSGICLYEAIRDNQGKIRDFRMKLANQRSSEIIAFSLEEMQKYTVKELMVIRGQSNLWPTLVHVVETGEPVYMEYFAEARQQWVAFSIKKFEDGYLLNYFDITERKNLEKRAHNQAEMLSGILNASITGLMTLEAIYSPSGKVEDFKFVLLNKAAEKSLGLTDDDKNKTYNAAFPSGKSNGFFDLYVNVLQTGIPVSKEFFYKGDRYNGWYYISVSKMNETTLVQSFSDITNSKLDKH